MVLQVLTMRRFILSFTLATSFTTAVLSREGPELRDGIEQLEARFDKTLGRGDLQDAGRIGAEIDAFVEAKFRDFPGELLGRTAEANWRQSIAQAYLKRRNIDSAANHFSIALRISDEAFGPGSARSKALIAQLLKLPSERLDETARPRLAGRGKLLDLKTTLKNHFEANGFAECVRCATEMSTLVRELHSDEPLIVAGSLYNLAIAHFYQQDELQAAHFIDQAVSFIDRSLAGPRAAWVLHNAANDYISCALLCKKLEQHDKAAELFERALAFREEQLALQHIDFLSKTESMKDVIGTLEQMANFYNEQQRDDDAERVLVRFLKVLDTTQSPEMRDFHKFTNEYSILSQLAHLYRKQGRHVEAEDVYYRSMKFLRQIAASSTPTTLRVGLAETCSFLGKFADAERQLSLAQQDMESKFRQGDFHQAFYLDEIAGAYYQQGRISDAERIWKKKLSILEQGLGPEADLYVQAADDLANWWTSLGEYEQADALLSQVLKRPRDRGAASKMSKGEVVNLLLTKARIHDARQEYEAAVESLQDARSIAIAADGMSAAAKVLICLAIVKSNQKQFGEANRMFQEGIQLLRAENSDASLLDHAHHNWAVSLMNEGRMSDALKIIDKLLDTEAYAADLAGVAARNKEFGEAEKLIQIALADVERRTGAPGRRAEYYGIRGDILWGQGRRLDAILDLEQALQLAEQQRVYSSQNEQDRAVVYSRFHSVLEKLLAWNTETKNFTAFFNTAERGKSRSLVDQMSRGSTDPLVGVNAKLAKEIREKHVHAQLTVAALEAQAASLENQRGITEVDRENRLTAVNRELDRARSEVVAAYREVQKVSPAYRLASSTDFRPIELATLQPWLKAQEAALLMYLLGDDDGYCFIVRGGGEVNVERLKVSEEQAKALGCDAGPITAKRAKAALLEKGKTVHELLANPRTAYSAVPRLAQLWELLIPDDVRQQLTTGQIENLIVVPDGPLSLLPFEALVVRHDEAKTDYLLDVGPPIQYAPSATVLYNLAHREPAGAVKPERVLTVARPTYRGAAAADRGKKSILDELRASARFSRGGAGLEDLPQTENEAGLLTQRFKQVGARVDSLIRETATEAKVREALPGHQIIHFACHGKADQEYGNFFGALALTPGSGAYDPANDGFLTLPEIYEINLSGCELAILSACQTNLGPQQRGEGVWGLSRAFLVAGCRRVIATNWSVNDLSTATLVDIYSRKLKETIEAGQPLDYSRALHEAKRELRQKNSAWATPTFWAPFVFVGPK
jgi:CHAT domain-containing protein/tetratricopeptide (TPR) repeat protein